MLPNTTGSITEYQFRIRSQEVDAQKRLRTSALIMLMQEASMQNVIDLRASVWDLAKDKVSWVLLRKEVVIHRIPTLRDIIKVRTYPSGFERVFAYRDFLVYDSRDELIASASSTWTLMNTATRKLQRIPSQFFKLAHNGDTLPRPDSKLIIDPSEGISYDYTVRMADLDWNNHVNNIVLSKLMIQSAPEYILRNKKLKKYVFHIKSECLLDETIKISSIQINDSETHHRIIRQSDDRLVAIAQCQW